MKAVQWRKPSTMALKWRHQQSGENNGWRSKESVEK